MTAETKYNTSDTVWFHFVADQPVKGEILEIRIKKVIGLALDIEYMISYRESPNDIEKRTALMKQEEVYPSIDTYLNALDRQHQDRIKRLRDVMNSWVTSFGTGGFIKKPIHTII